jgi:hypothetical protein
MLYYYKDSDATVENGSVDLLQSTVRPFDVSAECCTFEVAHGERAYQFQAETPAEMHRWVDVIAAVRSSVQQATQSKQRNLIPLPIRIFDDDGIDAFWKVGQNF